MSIILDLSALGRAVEAFTMMGSSPDHGIDHASKRPERGGRKYSR